MRGWRVAYNPAMGVENSGLTSFVIPCFNQGAWVGEAVASCLAQEGASVEVIVVDDGSDDGRTPGAIEGLAGPGVRVVHQANAGLPAARNAGAALARGGRLVFLDADDWVEPGFVRTLGAALDGDAGASHAYCQERLRELGEGVVWRVPAWDAVLLLVTNLHPVTCLVRRECFEAVGGFDATMTEGYEDWDLWLRFAGRGWHGARVREALFNWRRHSAQTMIDDATGRHEALYRRLLENHRALFEAHAMEVAVLGNVILRRAEAHWIDETGLPIEIRYLRAVRDAYQDSGAIRLARRVDGLLSRLPGPVRRGLGRLARGRGGRNEVPHPAGDWA